MQSLGLLKSVAALVSAPRVEQFLGVPAFAVLRRLGLVLGVPGVPALGVGLRVDLVLRVLGVAALGAGLRVDLVLRVLGAATLGVGLRVDLVLRRPGHRDAGRRSAPGRGGRFGVRVSIVISAMILGGRCTVTAHDTALRPTTAPFGPTIGVTGNDTTTRVTSLRTR